MAGWTHRGQQTLALVLLAPSWAGQEVQQALDPTPTPLRLIATHTHTLVCIHIRAHAQTYTSIHKTSKDHTHTNGHVHKFLYTETHSNAQSCRDTGTQTLTLVQDTPSRNTDSIPSDTPMSEHTPHVPSSFALRRGEGSTSTAPCGWLLHGSRQREA